MKRAFMDSSVTITVGPSPGKLVIGSGSIPAGLGEGCKRQQLDPPSMLQPAVWPLPDAIRTPQWSAFSMCQPLQPPQLCTNLHTANATTGDMGVSAAAGLASQLLLHAQHAPIQPYPQAAAAWSTPLSVPQLVPPITTQLSSSQIPSLTADQPMEQQQELQLPAFGAQLPEDAAATATVTLSIPASKAAAKQAPTDSLVADLHAHLDRHQAHVLQDSAGWPELQQQQQQQPCGPLEELQLLLPAVHAEYKSEMHLMLRACQVASNVTKHSTATGSTLLMDPASREQLQRQVLTNCNEKHSAVVAAFKHAAQAVEAAAATTGCAGFDHKQQGGVLLAAAAAAAAGNATDDAAVSAGSMSAVWLALRELRSSYQQELVAATSALFAICRGFGQRYALTPAASASIKAALAAAQTQHRRVEQLWQDIVLAAGGV